MNIVFMGTSDFAVSALRALTDRTDYAIKLVFTRPDAASGRGRTLIPSPVRLYAEKALIPVMTLQSFYEPVEAPDAVSGKIVNNSQPASSQGKRIINSELLSRIKAVEPDFIIVAAFGLVLPQQVLELPRFGCINIHGSLLPRWRGAAPIQRAILAGDLLSGVSIIRMESGLDTGAICCEATVPIEGKNARELSDELAIRGAELLIQALPRIADDSIEWREQSEIGCTYAEKVDKSELALDPDESAVKNIRRVLASTLQAPARCMIGERPVTILGATLAQEEYKKGTVLYLNNRLILATADGSFEVTSLKPDGKKAMDARAFVAGSRDLQKGAPSVIWSRIKREAP